MLFRSTAFYRLELDRYLEEKPEFVPSSCGTTRFFFTPDPAKTFHRGATEYFMHGRQDSVAGIDSPKSTGEEIGVVTGIDRDSFRISGTNLPSNNDGLTFVNRLGESAGLKVNRVEKDTIYPDRMNGLFVGARIYRNWDHSFQMALGKKTSERKISIAVKLESTVDGFKVGAVLVSTRNEVNGNLEVNLDGTDAKTYPTENSIVMDKVPANDPAKSSENILRQLAK